MENIKELKDQIKKLKRDNRMLKKKYGVKTSGKFCDYCGTELVKAELDLGKPSELYCPAIRCPQYRSQY